jgi:hypothetical protein
MTHHLGLHPILITRGFMGRAGLITGDRRFDAIGTVRPGRGVLDQVADTRSRWFAVNSSFRFARAAASASSRLSNVPT